MCVYTAAAGCLHCSAANSLTAVEVRSFSRGTIRVRDSLPYGTKICPDTGMKGLSVMSHKTKPQLKNYQLVCTYQPIFSDMHVKHYKYQLIIYYPALLLSTTCLPGRRREHYCALLCEGRCKQGPRSCGYGDIGHVGLGKSLSYLLISQIFGINETKDIFLSIPSCS